MEDDPKDPKDYEIGYLARDEKGAPVVTKALAGQGAEILLEGPVERIALAYSIEHETSAYFGYVQFRVRPDAIAAVKRDLAGAKTLLRFLIITPPPARPKPRWEGGKPRAKAIVAPAAAPAPTADHSPASSLPLSNEALEKKIEEILK